jgi:hypothetical protein
MEVVFFIESIFFVFDYFRGVHYRWHGATPCRVIRRIKAGAASCGAVSTQVLAQRRGRNSPQSQFIISAKNIRHGPAKAKLIVFINDSKNGNV